MSGSSNGPRSRDLPPVAPPSGRFIAQLFLVPGLIVFFVVLLVIAINYMFVGGQSAEQFLARIDSDNPDIRWRGANDLAQVLKRKESVALRSNVGFALDLSERLDKAVAALRKEEALIGESLKNESSARPEAAFRKLEAQRNLVSFLSAALGDFNFPAGVPSLSGVIAEESGPDIVNLTIRRRGALWSLANLGQNRSEFAKLTPTQQNLIVGRLREEADSDNPTRREAARSALHYLAVDPLPAGDVVTVDAALDVASKAQDQYLRQIVGLAWNFWDGPLAEPILLRLSRDDGFGTLVQAPKEGS